MQLLLACQQIDVLADRDRAEVPVVALERHEEPAEGGVRGNALGGLAIELVHLAVHDVLVVVREPHRLCRVEPPRGRGFFRGGGGRRVEVG